VCREFFYAQLLYSLRKVSTGGDRTIVYYPSKFKPDRVNQPCRHPRQVHLTKPLDYFWRRNEDPLDVLPDL
jgi:hypothetical protein